MRLMRLLLILACVLTTASIIAALRHKAKNTGGNHVAVAGPAVPGSTTIAAAGSSRRTYPYSVIPGGAHDRGELQAAIRTDALVREHYRDFAVAWARVVVLQEDRHRYVSFRMSGRIFWTAKRLLIPKGETLLTDGIHYARTRCGNRLSDKAEPETTPFEPDLKVLNLSSISPEPSRTLPRLESPAIPVEALQVSEVPFAANRFAPLSSPELSPPEFYSAGPGLAPPYFAVLPPLSSVPAGSGFTPDTPLNIVTPDPVLPADVPEPGALYLLGLAGVIALCVVPRNHRSLRSRS